jgi:hypothetical protein
LFAAKGQIVGPAGKEILEGVRALRVVIDVCGRAQVSVTGWGPKLGGDEGTGDCAGVHLPKYSLVPALVPMDSVILRLLYTKVDRSGDRDIGIRVQAGKNG